MHDGSPFGEKVGQKPLTIGVAQVSSWCDPISDELFEIFYLGKLSALRTRPDDIPLNANLENASRAG